MSKNQKNATVVVPATKIVKGVKTKVQSTNLSDFSNLSDKANASTQTISHKKLIKPILHSVGIRAHKLGDPIYAIGSNERVRAALR